MKKKTRGEPRRKFYLPHYRIMAAVISSISSKRCQKDIAEKMCVAFATDSPDFNKERFMKAAVTPDEVGEPAP